ncbi:unnamed protein product [Strongylus vulgaris]|uniref:RRM domain-containing protein n=1 Tax=Strongylus vulgaris TaxID=40348 RepID=A0A3P7LQ04_STRVU|nr:unnamed protein product [Strongylus vulgaris]
MTSVYAEVSSAGMARVYLGRLPFRARESDIERFFQGYGRITDIAMKRGFAFIEFESKRDAEDAVDELNGRSILGDRRYVQGCSWRLLKVARMEVTFTAIDHVLVLVTADVAAALVLEAVIAADAAAAEGEDVAVRAVAVLRRKDRVDAVTRAVLAAADLQIRSVAQDVAALRNATSVPRTALPRRPQAEVHPRKKREAQVDLLLLNQSESNLHRKERAEAPHLKMTRGTLRSVHRRRRLGELEVLLGKALIAVSPLVVTSREVLALPKKR